MNHYLNKGTKLIRHAEDQPSEDELRDIRTCPKKVRFEKTMLSVIDNGHKKIIKDRVWDPDPYPDPY
jgi:hypothetical protein